MILKKAELISKSTHHMHRKLVGMSPPSESYAYANLIGDIADKSGNQYITTHVVRKGT